MSTSSSMVFDLSKQIDELKKTDLVGFVFNKTFVLDDDYDEVYKSIMLEKVATYDIHPGNAS
jgi:hypothetical protein